MCRIMIQRDTNGDLDPQSGAQQVQEHRRAFHHWTCISKSTRGWPRSALSEIMPRKSGFINGSPPVKAISASADSVACNSSKNATTSLAVKYSNRSLVGLDLMQLLHVKLQSVPVLNQSVRKTCQMNRRTRFTCFSDVGVIEFCLFQQRIM